jgi:ubiquinone/menaquinone biosynthesis C-methylase UbiE
VLEIGGGDGSMAEALLQRAPDVSLTVTDYDPRMLDAARRRLARFGARVRVEWADATRLRFANDSFDVVLSFIMLHHVVEWERAVAEAVRVLKSGGVLLGYDLTNTPLTRLSHTLDRSVARPLSLGELREQTRRLPVAADIEQIWRGLVVRLALTKRSDVVVDATTLDDRASLG